tara:strand:+ start:266 stop:613 length:348 start_codon:yes stop_codon:yes gene_type:complete
MSGARVCFAIAAIGAALAAPMMAHADVRDELGLGEDAHGVVFENGTVVSEENDKVTVTDSKGNSMDCTDMTDDCASMINAGMESGVLTTFADDAQTGKRFISKLKSGKLKPMKGR